MNTIGARLGSKTSPGLGDWLAVLAGTSTASAITLEASTTCMSGGRLTAAILSERFRHAQLLWWLLGPDGVGGVGAEVCAEVAVIQCR